MKNKSENPRCACGCGRPVKWYKYNNQGKGGWCKFIRAHNFREPIIPLEICKEMGIKEGSRYPKGSSYLSKESRQKMSKAKQGINNPRWKGGISPYGQAWTNDLRKQIKDRDDNKCQNPNCPNDKDPFSLQVHHINYIKKDNDPENLISLCRRCNVWANRNKKYWMKLYKEIIDVKKI
jgi:hypothetical protein